MNWLQRMVAGKLIAVGTRMRTRGNHTEAKYGMRSNARTDNSQRQGRPPRTSGYRVGTQVRRGSQGARLRGRRTGTSTGRS